jgi:NAD(P)-dependent dehydrogenase (short-subunit alcohol dehydrogenase family)
MQARGVKISIEALDVTKLDDVRRLKQHLAKTMPPVGGVVNGAMVLEDRVFSQMSLDTLNRVMRPKTVGSRNLDLIFDDSDMEFFIMTSSFAAIGGHAGQSNYAAANMVSRNRCYSDASLMLTKLAVHEWLGGITSPARASRYSFEHWRYIWAWLPASRERRALQWT